MANTSSAKKAIRVAERRAKVNLRTKVAFKKARKEVLDSMKKGATAKKAEKLLSTAYKKIDKAAKLKVIGKNTAARYKSRLAAKITAK